MTVFRPFSSLCTSSAQWLKLTPNAVREFTYLFNAEGTPVTREYLRCLRDGLPTIQSLFIGKEDPVFFPRIVKGHLDVLRKINRVILEKKTPFTIGAGVEGEFDLFDLYVSIRKELLATEPSGDSRSTIIRSPAESPPTAGWLKSVDEEFLSGPYERLIPELFNFFTGGRTPVTEADKIVYSSLQGKRTWKKRSP